MEIEWRPARWLGSSAEVTLTHSFIQALHLQRSTGRLFAAAWAAEAAGQNEVAVRGACPAAARDRPRRTRAHHAHPPRAARKRSEFDRSQQIYLIALPPYKWLRRDFCLRTCAPSTGEGRGTLPNPSHNDWPALTSAPRPLPRRGLEMHFYACCAVPDRGGDLQGRGAAFVDSHRRVLWKQQTLRNRRGLQLPARLYRSVFEPREGRRSEQKKTPPTLRARSAWDAAGWRNGARPTKLRLLRVCSGRRGVYHLEPQQPRPAREVTAPCRASRHPLRAPTHPSAPYPAAQVKPT